MAELTDQQKEEIVLLLARFRGPAEVKVAMQTEHGLDLPLQQIVQYDPSRPAYTAGEKWRPIFDAARKMYLEEVAAVPIANQGFRLNELNELYQRAKKAGNLKLAAELAEQAAKEVGGVLTNARELNIKDGRRPRDMTPEDRTAAIGALISEALEQRKAEQPTKH